MRVLFLLPYVFIPPNKGNKHLIFNLLKYVTAHAECDLILLLDVNVDKEEVQRNIRSAFPTAGEIWLFEKPSGLSLLAARFRAMACGDHPSTGRYWNESLAEWLRDRIGPQTHDIMHFDMFYTSQYRRYCQNIPSVLVPSDAYSLSAKLTRKATSNIVKKIRMVLEQILMATHEKRYYRHFDLVCPVAKVDAEYLSRHTRHPNIRAIGVAIGDEFVTKQPRAFEEGSNGEKCRIIHVGPIGEAGASECLLKFLRQGYPKIRAQFPNVKITVLGRNPARLLRDYFKSDKSVQHVEFVEDYIGFLENDWVYVHPQQTNAGYQTKVQQAMALGLPVVGFEHAFTGMDVESGKDCFICRTQDEFAEATIALLQNPQLRRTVGLAGANTIREKYSAKRVGEEMIHCYQELVSAGERRHQERCGPGLA